jgi:UDP-3-O-[3-hydroxymyristoyl] glucosamine N-acyltransferase
VKLGDLAKKIGADLIASNQDAQDLEIKGIAPLDVAGASEVTFLSNPKYAKKLRETKAAAVILGSAVSDLEVPQLVHRNPYAAMAETANLFYKLTHTYQGQSKLAVVHAEAKVDPSATLYPFSYIEKGAVIGANCVVYPHVYVGENSRVGDDSVIFPSATIMPGCTVGRKALIHAGVVIGADGFGFAPTREGIVKIPQVGGVVIGDDVEIGPTSTIDRGAFNDTVLGNGCKLDSQVHIAHGVQIGEFGMICGQAAIAGSTRVGKRLIMAGHSAIGPSLEIGDGVVLGPKAGMTRSTAEAGEYIGMPSMPGNAWRRQVVALQQVPELLKAVRALTAKVEALEKSCIKQDDGELS